MSEAFFQESAPVPGRRHPARDGATIGRNPRADIPLLDPQVSRNHARLHIDDLGVGVEDLGSHNGTYLNETRISGRVTLREGDSIRMGETVWRFFVRAPAPAHGDVPPPDPLPSEVRNIETIDAAGSPFPAPSFSEPEPPPTRPPGAVARVALATVISYAVVATTAVAVALYLALR